MPKVTITIDVENGLVVVRNGLCKTCGKPVENGSTASVFPASVNPASVNTASVNTDSVPMTGTVPDRSVLYGLVDHGPKSVEQTLFVQAKDQVQTKQITPFRFAADAHPFPLTGLTPAQIAAVGYMSLALTSKPPGVKWTHDAFNDALWGIVAAGEAVRPVAERDAILRDGMNLRFWKTRPECRVDAAYIVGNPVLWKEDRT